ncbi:histidinol-phosphatase [Paenibacillus sp. J31TS4]|uniref:histidinol-phosphatase HisJ n=1 Tax=Paenibacillus sp. J31TS4 TaxID=2807195 RepID=UPI001B061470|nr:histidinol-phosphatase HisJ [Paenibacillus sp. J31TS4]GIP38111.1 histidinol-phosphatase [Paenibacillus sp. J31TS4]
MVKWDGHTHTSFCKHGNPAGLGEYLERAAALGFTRYSVTEHPPLPERWVDDEGLMAELAMGMDEMPAYLDEVERHKCAYEGRLEVLAGLELDYLPGAEAFTFGLVDRFGERLDDYIVSVHYLPGKRGMRCIDFTPDDFREGLISYYGSMERVVEEYYDHVEEAIGIAARLPGGTKRIGHVNLIEKFRLVLPPIDMAQIERRLERLVPRLAAAGVGLDVNMAGLRVPTCGRSYVPEWFLGRCIDEGIAVVYGSDAHKPEHVGMGWEEYARAAAPQA